MTQKVSYFTKSEMLDAIKAYLNMTKNSEFARFLGISSQAVSNWYSRNTFDAELLYTKCDFINPAWLLTGKGSMLTNADSAIEDKEQKPDAPIARPATNPNEGIPLIPIEAMAGALTCEQTILEYECERYVVPMFKGADFLIPVKGSSMYPKYSSGDIVACQRVSMSDLFFQWNKVYVIDTNQGALIKRIKPGSDKEHVLIVSDNEKYDPFELPLAAIHAVALVIGVIRLE